MVVFYHGGGWATATWTPTTRWLAPAVGAEASWCRWTTDWRPSTRTRRGIDDSWSAPVGRRARRRARRRPRTHRGRRRLGRRQISAAMTQLARDNGGPPLVFQLLWYPATTGDMTLPSTIENADAADLEANCSRRPAVVSAADIDMSEPPSCAHSCACEHCRFVRPAAGVHRYRRIRSASGRRLPLRGFALRGRSSRRSPTTRRPCRTAMPISRRLSRPPPKPPASDCKH